MLTFFPWFRSSQTFDIQVSIDNAVVTIDVLVTGQPSGTATFFLSVETIGPLAPGDYEIVANYRVDGVLEDSATTSLFVVPVRAVPALQTRLVMIVLILLVLLLAFAFRTPVTRPELRFERPDGLFFVSGFCRRYVMRMKRLSAERATRIGLVLLSVAATPLFAQTVTIVGTQHLKGLEVSPSTAQLEHAVDALSAFEPTQVCVERMSGSRIQALAADPARNAMTLRPDAHGRPLAATILPLGVHMQVRLAIQPADARDKAAALAARWHELSESERVGLVALQIAGYEFHSAVLNWSYLEDEARESASEQLPRSAMEALDEHLQSSHEVYALAVPIARRAGLHVLCTADSLEDESSGMQVAMSLGGEKILDSPEVRGRIEEYLDRLSAVWRPDDGPAALTRMLAFMNSDEFAELDQELQWETLRQHDNDNGAFQRRLMYWHARTAQISSELYRALARGGDERVMLIIGAAHRPFNEAEMRALGWVRVVPASRFLSEGQGDDSGAGAPGEESSGSLAH